MTHDLVLSTGLHKRLVIYRSRRASDEELGWYHGKEYIDILKTPAAEFERRYTPDERDNYGVTNSRSEYNDCPLFEGVYNFSRWSAGATIDAAKLISNGNADIAINWSGGLHHAQKNSAYGFCYTNDGVLGIQYLLKSFARVLYLDIDVHHGDGVQNAFEQTDRVLTVSFHHYVKDKYFFPGTGDVTEAGSGPGQGYSVNIPLKQGIDDESYKSIFEPTMEHLMSWYRPKALVIQCGADSLAYDRLGTFNLTMKGHGACVKFMRKYNLPIMLIGGGGYTIRNVARTWCYETAIALGIEQDKAAKIPAESLYLAQYGPDYAFDVPAQPDVRNQNSRKYLNNLK
ncbi:histone deacetylase [Geranomyces variabilis]|nr:histone deacetylase [Geranomyces variabilis]